MDALALLSNQIAQMFLSVDQATDAAGYERLAGTCERVRGALREYVQAQTRSSVAPLIAKLKTDAPISADELRLIRLWIIGDADAYVAVERSVPDWIAELKRIATEVVRVCAAAPGVDSAEELRALLYDAGRVARDVANYLDQKERATRFQQATQQLDRDNRSLFARLLAEKLDSPDL